MKRLLSMILLCCLLCACAADAQPRAGYTFTDDTGAEVTVAEKPQKVEEETAKKTVIDCIFDGIKAEK